MADCPLLMLVYAIEYWDNILFFSTDVKDHQFWLLPFFKKNLDLVQLYHVTMQATSNPWDVGFSLYQGCAQVREEVILNRKELYFILRSWNFELALLLK